MDLEPLSSNSQVPLHDPGPQRVRGRVEVGATAGRPLSSPSIESILNRDETAA